jgi:phospholipid N-methyltransferase
MIINEDVLTVLSTAVCHGNRLWIEQRLSRPMYLATNEVLEAIGGKWDRKQKAHVFDGDAASLLDVVLVEGCVTTRRDIGFFPTPPPLARQLVASLDVRRGEVALEPSAGTGRIADALLEAGAVVHAVERDAKMRAALHGRGFFVSDEDDFMLYSPVPSVGFDVIAMNPPFCQVGLGDHIDHVRKAFDLLRSGGRLAAIMPASIIFRQDRRHTQFRSWATGLGGHIEPLPDGSFRESGTLVRTCTVALTRRAAL